MSAMHSAVRTVPAAVLIAFLACASKGPGRADQLERPPTLIEVSNQDFADAVIYLVRSSSRIRLGTVEGHSEQTFRLPAFADPRVHLELVARPIGGRAYRLPRVNLSPGQTVQVTLYAQHRLSQVTVSTK